jgi:hypothetical protein
MVSLLRGARPGALGALLIVIVGCAGSPPGEPAPTSAPTPAPSPTLSRISLPVLTGTTFEGLVDVNGHDIYARCAGTGSPTILYFTGWAPDLDKRGVQLAKGLEQNLGPNYRMCSYERRNTGRSATVAGTQTPEDVVADVDGLMDKLGEKGPFILLGASFGGLVSSAYAVTHPDRVAGELLLDAATGVEYEFDGKTLTEGPCAPANRDEDANRSLEKVDNCSLEKYAYDRIDQQPAVPLLYLAATDSSDRGSPATDLVRQDWVKTWSPGEWRVVNAPHWMDQADTGLVSNAIKEVIALSAK